MEFGGDKPLKTHTCLGCVVHSWGLDRQNPEVMYFPLKTDKFVLLFPFITEGYGVAYG